jgi:hypothetical protein
LEKLGKGKNLKTSLGCRKILNYVIHKKEVILQFQCAKLCFANAFPNTPFSTFGSLCLLDTFFWFVFGLITFFSLRCPILKTQVQPMFIPVPSPVVHAQDTFEWCDGSVSISKQSMQLFVLVFTPTAICLLVYEVNFLWKQFKLNSYAQCIKLPLDSDSDSIEVKLKRNNLLAISLRTCIAVVLFFSFTVLMVLRGNLLL